MLIKYMKVDANGLFVGDELYEDTVQIDDVTLIDSRQYPVPEGLHLPKWDSVNLQWIEGKTDAELLEIAKQNKITEIQAAYESDLTTCSSPALGTSNTYLIGLDGTGRDYMVLFAGEYAYVKSDDYDLQPILWYTVEQGNVQHTKDQFIQVYLDARNHVANTKYKKADKDAQIAAAAEANDKAALLAIAW